MKKYCILFILVFISCNKNNDFENNIVKSNKKWLHISNYYSIDSLKNYEFIYYIKFNKNKKWIYHFMTDNSIPWNENYHNWCYSSNDSILIMGEEKLKFKVVKYVKDTIYLENNEKKKEFFININPDSSDM